MEACFERDVIPTLCGPTRSPSLNVQCSETFNQKIKAAEKIPVYLEIGSKKVFACAVEWPGWSMHGPDEAAALQALLDFGPRFDTEGRRQS